MHPADSWERPAPDWPPHEVRTVCEAHLAAVDDALPGLVEGLYLHGSLGFGEWYSGRSDIDFVAVTAERPDAHTVRRLQRVHERLGETFPRPSYDGFYATWADLAAPVDRCPDVPCTLGGQWRDDGRFDVNPVTWHELAGHGVTIRGPRLEDVEIWTDQRVLRHYVHENLATYWADEVASLARFPEEAARADVMTWCVLGIPRLHHLLATDRLTSKNGAGVHAVTVFGERWRPLVTEALAYRATGERAGMLSDGDLAEDVPRFAALVLDAGLKMSP
ncbi:MAG: hypothetical protein ACTHKG_01615 [Nocardioides sp.]